MTPAIKTVIVTNVPAPYRAPVWHRVAQAEGISVELIFCAPAHIDTSFNSSEYGFKSHFLSGQYQVGERRFMHSDLGVWALLNRLNPDVVITTGYIPTFLFAFVWAIAHRVPHIAMTDGTVRSEKSLTWLHRIVRLIVLGKSSAFVGACEGSCDLFKQYGVDKQFIHKSHLCADNKRFSCRPSQDPVDFIFCGRFLAHKQPLFAMQVAHETAIRLGRKTSIDFVGSGNLEPEMLSYAAAISDLVACRFLGYASQAELPQLYANAKIFLFPSEWDPWGVVANEACAAGLPVIVSPHAGVAEELVIDGQNGYVRELDISLWAEATAKLLTDETLHSEFQKNSREQVVEYNFDNSARGLVNAIRQAYGLTKLRGITP